MEEINQLSPKESEQILKSPNSWREKGEREEIQKTALEMLKEDLPIELIEKVTHLDLAEIEDLKRTL